MLLMLLMEEDRACREHLWTEGRREGREMGEAEVPDRLAFKEHRECPPRLS